METTLTLASQINELHLKAESLASSAKANASQAIAVAIECGKLLNEQKKNVGFGGWLDWLKVNCPDISERTAQKYMRLQKRVLELSDANPNCGADLVEDDPEKVSAILNGSPKTLRQAYIAAGVIPEDKAVSKDKEDSTEPTITFTKHIDALVLWYRKRTEHDPIENWSPEVRTLLMNELRPWVKIYDELNALQYEEFDGMNVVQEKIEHENLSQNAEQSESL